MANLLSRLIRPRQEISRLTLSDYIRQRVEAVENPFSYAAFPPVITVDGRRVEQVEDSYTNLATYAYRGDSVVAACMRVRRDLFRQAKFCWRQIGDSGPGRVFRDEQLRLLDRPWPNGTTGELLTRMITDVDLCGNSFVVNEGDRLRWLRPDWTSIVLSGDPLVDVEIDVLGYTYTPGGGVGDRDEIAYKPDQVCHWAPEQDPLAFYRGMSWVSKAIEDIQGDRAASTHKLAFFRNGATLGPIVRVPQGVTLEQFKEFVAAAEAAHAGAANAYKTMYVGGGAEVTLAAADFRQLDLKAVQGGYETRIAAVAGVHPVLVGLSEGMQGASLNAGNFNSAKRATADMTLYALWQDACGALEAFFDPPDDAELWIRERDIPFLREERKDQAEISKAKMLTVEAGIRAGYKADALVDFAETDDITVLKGQHTGLTSVQLLPPGETGADAEPVDFGALRDEPVRALAWVDEDEMVSRALSDAIDELVRDRYDVRIPKGFEGGGRFRKLSDRIFAALKDWLDGEGDDDPLGEMGLSKEQLRRVAKEFGLLKPRERVSEDQLKVRLYQHIRKHGRDSRDAPDKPDAVKKAAPAKKAPAKKAAPKKPGVDPREIAERVGEQSSEVEVVQLLAGDPRLTSAKLRQVADELGIDVPEGMRAKSALQLHIAEKVARGRGLPMGDVPAAKKAAPAASKGVRAEIAGHLRQFAELFTGREAFGDDRDARTAPRLKKLADGLEDGSISDRDAAEQLSSLAAEYEGTATGISFKSWVKNLAPKAPAKKAAPKAPDPAVKSRELQAKIDAFGDVSDTLAEVEELIDSEATPRQLESRIRGAGNRRNLPPGLVDELLDASGDRSRLAAVLDRVASERGLRRVGKSGDVVTFDPKKHRLMGGGSPEGSRVRVLRPGYEADIDGQRRQLSKAVVEDTDADAVPTVTAAPKRAAPGTAPRPAPRVDEGVPLRGNLEGDNMRMHGDSLTMSLARAYAGAGRNGSANRMMDLRRRATAPGPDWITQPGPDGITPQQVVDELRAILDQEQDPVFRRRLERAIEGIDAPMTPLPDLPPNTPPLARKLIEDLHAIPYARKGDGAPAGVGVVRGPSLVDQLAEVYRDVAAQRRGGGGRRPENRIRNILRGQTHEVNEAAFRIWEMERRLDSTDGRPSPLADELRKWERGQLPTVVGDVAPDVPDISVARERQAKIDSVRPVAEALVDLDYLLTNDADPDVIDERLRGVPGIPSSVADELSAAARGTNPAAAMRRVAARHGLRRHTPAAGGVERFDPDRHQPLAGWPEGQDVTIVNPGYEADIDGERVQLSKATVAPVAPDAPAGDRALQSVPVDLDQIPVTDPNYRALMAYRSQGFRQVNDYLARRGIFANDPAAVRIYSQQTEEWIRAVDATMARSRLTADVEVWRGLQVAEDVLGSRDTWPRSFVGREWTDPAFVSTSASRSVAEGFAEGSGVMLRIRVPRGTSAIRLGDRGESEILLDRGLKMRVTGQSTRQVGGQPVRVLDVEVVRSDTPRTPDADTIVSDATLTIRQKRARLRKLGFSEEQIDQLVPLARPRRTAARSADPDADLTDEDLGDDYDPDEELDDDEDEDLDEEMRADLAALWDVDADDVERAIGNRLKHYWTRGEGLAKWATKPHPWTALYRQLRKHVGSARAKRIASQWFHDVFGIWPGERKGKNPVGPG